MTCAPICGVRGHGAFLSRPPPPPRQRYLSTSDNEVLSEGTQYLCCSVVQLPLFRLRSGFDVIRERELSSGLDTANLN